MTLIYLCLSWWCECVTDIDWYYIRYMRQGIQEITYFIHSRKIGNGMVDVVIPRYMTYDKRYVQSMSEDKPLPLYYLCLSRLLTLYCGCIQTQRSYRKRKYEDQTWRSLKLESSFAPRPRAPFPRSRSIHGPRFINTSRSSFISRERFHCTGSPFPAFVIDSRTLFH